MFFVFWRVYLLGGIVSIVWGFCNLVLRCKGLNMFLIFEKLRGYKINVMNLIILLDL